MSADDGLQLHRERLESARQFQRIGPCRHAACATHRHRTPGTGHHKIGRWRAGRFTRVIAPYFLGDGRIPAAGKGGCKAAQIVRFGGHRFCETPGTRC